MAPTFAFRLLWLPSPYFFLDAVPLLNNHVRLQCCLYVHSIYDTVHLIHGQMPWGIKIFIQQSYSHSSTWCVGDFMPFMITITHLRIKLLPLTNGRWGMAVTVHMAIRKL